MSDKGDAWLIHWKGSERYLDINVPEDENLAPHITWTDDIYEGLRLSRKQDVEKIRALLGHDEDLFEGTEPLLHKNTWIDRHYIPQQEGDQA